jgi:putative transcriptional regulator
MQLDEELSSKSWIIVDNEYASDIIQKSTTSFWKENMQQLGGDYLLWSNAPENPTLN